MDFRPNQDKRTQTIKRGKKLLFNKQKFLLFVIIPCFIAPIPIAIKSYLSSDVETATILTSVFGGIFLLFGGFLLGFMLYQMRLDYANQTDEKLVLERDYFEYWYTMKKERYCRRVRYDDIEDVIYNQKFNTCYVYFDKLELYRGESEQNMRQVIPERNRSIYKTIPCYFGDDNSLLYDTLVEEVLKRGKTLDNRIRVELI